MNTVSQEDILCFIRSAPRFHLPDDSSSPLIMIGAGSGIAPFRSFWHEREAIYENQKKDSSKKTLGPMYLFFGCRQSKLDDIYKSETAPLVKKGVITKVLQPYPENQACRKNTYNTDSRRNRRWC
ncbi:nitric oxide synthase-like protein [Trichonephila inaurata madagascariensis]|uniref:nitric-oxide synthase (NADPH) n=1 Tax=Trichonephila inaurata madagascariensis TaxID=2747483 RepID=A0A8X6MAF2_9ARAC|nr:nitric oxide synthase-like protein [Trichonephila inaurata madagascariensis]